MQKQFLIVRDSDQFIYGTQLQDHPDDGPIIPQGGSPIDGTTLIEFDGDFTYAGRRDSEAAYWIDGAVQWVETATLDEAKAAAWSRIKAARDAAEAAPFAFEGGIYDPNKENISGAALAALLAQLAGQEVADEWTLADNSRRVLTGPQIINLGLLLTQRVKAIHAAGRALRDQLDAAQTAAEAYACVWPTEEFTDGEQ